MRPERLFSLLKIDSFGDIMKSVVFMGTPDFAVTALQALIDSDDYDVKLVISQPDKPQGRKQVLTPPPVKELALQNNLDIYQPDSLKSDEAYDRISLIKPDFIVVSAYGKILPQRILDIPKFGCVNLHGSLLPKYRGAAPIQWSVINGDKVTGVTTMLMNAGLDTGDILLVSEKEISENETAGQVFDALADLCPELLIRTLDGLYNGEIVPSKQDDAMATYVSVLSKDMSVINWRENANTIHNLIRGLNPWPVARTTFKGKILKIFTSSVCDIKFNGDCGDVFVEDGSIYVVCGDTTCIRIDELQAEGSKRMTSADFLRGRSFDKGYSFLSEV